MANTTELQIEQVEPGPDGVAGGVRITATVPWSEMTTRTMDKMIQRRVALPTDDGDDDDVFVSGDMPIDYDALLIVGAIPAVVTAVARLRPHAMYGLMNGYAWELHKQRSDLARRNHRDRSEELWLNAKIKSIELLLRELRFAGLTADGALTRTELVKEERLLRGDKTLDIVNALIRQVSLRRYSLVDHSTWWFVGRQIGTPLFNQLLDEAREAQLRRSFSLPRRFK